MSTNHTAYIALGSNLGERAANLSAAVEKLRTHGILVEALSEFMETDPVGAPPGTEYLRYLNAAACVRTALPPRALLAVLLDVEAELGRRRVEGERNAPRTIDLDLLLYDDLIEGWTTPSVGAPVPTLRAGASAPEQVDFSLPHPRMHLRTFVLKPLGKIAPQARHPIFKKTISELLAEAELRGRLKINS